MTLHTMFDSWLVGLIALMPGFVMIGGGFYLGRRSRDAEMYGYRLSARFLEQLAITNATIADKVIAEISKSARKEK